jgi:hypothetical protein
MKEGKKARNKERRDARTRGRIERGEARVDVGAEERTEKRKSRRKDTGRRRKETEGRKTY